MLKYCFDEFSTSGKCIPVKFKKFWGRIGGPDRITIEIDEFQFMEVNFKLHSSMELLEEEKNKCFPWRCDETHQH